MGELSCHIVRDLLPLYQDGLLSEESKREVESHLKNCEQCREIYRKMHTALVVVNDEMENKKDIDYLRKVKWHNYGKILLAVCAVLAILAAIWASKIFYIGEMADSSEMAWKYDVMDNNMYLHIMAVGSASGFRNWQIDTVVTDDGKVHNITANEVLISPLSDGEETFVLSLDDVKEIAICGEVIWQDGVAITPLINNLYQAHTPYVGDIVAIGKVAKALQIADTCGNFKTELHTSSEPYIWSFDFTDSLANGTNADVISGRMDKNAYFLFALIDNLSVVEWGYTDNEGVWREKSVSVAQIDANLAELVSEYNRKNGTDFVAKESVKDYSQSLKDLQVLFNILN